MGFEYKDELKGLLSEYMQELQEQGLTEERDRDYWICPICASGTGNNGTAAFHIFDGVDGMKFHCFSCNFGGDIFDLIGYTENLITSDFKKKYNRAVKIMRPYLDGTKERTSKSIRVGDTDSVGDYKEYLQNCHNDVKYTLYFHGRGISEPIIEKFKLGFDTQKRAVIIPSNLDFTGYVHRIIWKGGYKYCKWGQDLFNTDALYSTGDFVFICEGQFDALSFEEIGYSAMAIGGVGEVTKLVTQLKQSPCQKTLILALDNDNAGRKATGRFIEELAEQEVDCDYIVVSNLYDRHKDANEYLVADRTGFQRKVKNLVRSLKSSVFYNGN